MNLVPSRLTIRQLVLLLALWACLPMAALCGFQIYQMYQADLRQQRAEIRFWRDSAAEQLETHLADTRLSLAQLATHHAVNGTVETFRQLAIQLCAVQPAHRSLTWLGPDGRVAASTDPTIRRGSILPWAPATPVGGFTLGRGFREAGGDWLVPMFQPLPARGALVLLTDPQAHLTAHLARTWPKSGVTIMALEPGGNVTLHSQDPDRYLGTNFAAATAFFRLHDAGVTEGEAPGFDGQLRLFASARVAGSEWIVRASLKKADLEAALSRNIRVSVLLLVGSLATAVVAAYWLAARIAGPAKALASAARETAAGGTAAPLPERGPAEVADTARAFNEMVAQRRQARTRLEESELRYRLLFENMTVAFALHELICDAGGQPVDSRFLEVNPAFEQLFGRKAADTVGRTLREILPRTETAWIERFGQVALSGEPLAFEEHSREFGRSFEVFCFRPGPGRFAVIFSDITERFRSREALDLANRRYASLVDSIGGIVWDMGPDGRFTFVNSQAEHMLGYPVSRWLEEPEFWEQKMHPEDRAWVPAKSSAEAAAGRDHILDYRMLHADGHVVWLRDIVSVVRDNQTPGRVIGVMFDITEQKQADLALRSSERRLELALEGGDLGFWDWDMVTNRIDFSERWITMLEYDPATFQSSFAEWEELLHPEDRARVMATVKAHFETGETPFYECPHRLKARSGRWVWVLARGRIVERDAAGRALRAAGTHLDITSQQLAAEEKAALEKKLQETQKLESLGVLAGGIAHDFNNLLTGILGNASLARLEMPPGAPGLDSLAEVERAAERAANLCKQMLAYSGRGRFVIQRLNLNRIIEDTTHLLNLSIGKGVIVRFNLTAQLPAIEVDVTQVRQVIMNLVINASEAIGSRSGVIALGTGIRRVDGAYLATASYTPNVMPGDYVYVEVSDDGTGMSAETLARIFDPFFTTKFTGRGLGLAAVLGIVRGHKGAIKVHSALGKGTTFTLLFPIADGTATPLETRVAAPATWRGSGHLLVIDDEDSIRALAARMLERLGFTTELFGDPRTAIASFRSDPNRFDLVLLDLTMPHLGGEETFRQLRALRPDLRVLLMSGFTEEDVVSRFAGQGLAGFVQKPFDTGMLVNELRRVFGPANA